MKTEFKNKPFKVGDEVVHAQFGEGVVKSIHNDYLMAVGDDWNLQFGLDGKQISTDLNPTIFHKSENPFEMAAKWMELQEAESETSITFPQTELNAILTDTKHILQHVTLDKHNESVRRCIIDRIENGLFTPSPKQGHNRAELLEVVKAIAVDYGDAAQCVVFAQSLINEVNKVSYGESK